MVRSRAEDAHTQPALPSLGAWAGAVIVGELLGFGATVLIAYVGIAIGGVPETATGHLVAALIMTLAGLIEGASLGWFQWRVLRRLLPRLRAREWMAPTMILAATGWAIGMCIPVLIDAGAHASSEPVADPGLAATAFFAAIFGALIGVLFGAAQWVVLRRHAAHAGRWVLGNALGWALGLPSTYVAGSLTAETTPWWAVAVLALAAAAWMGLGVALGTWTQLRRLTPA